MNLRDHYDETRPLILSPSLTCSPKRTEIISIEKTQALPQANLSWAQARHSDKK